MTSQFLKFRKWLLWLCGSYTLSYIWLIAICNPVDCGLHADRSRYLAISAGNFYNKFWKSNALKLHPGLPRTIFHSYRRPIGYPNCSPIHIRPPWTPPNHLIPLTNQFNPMLFGRCDQEHDTAASYKLTHSFSVIWCKLAVVLSELGTLTHYRVR